MLWRAIDLFLTNLCRKSPQLLCYGRYLFWTRGGRGMRKYLQLKLKLKLMVTTSISQLVNSSNGNKYMYKQHANKVTKAYQLNWFNFLRQGDFGFYR